MGGEYKNTASNMAREASLRTLVKIEESKSYVNLLLPSHLKKIPPGQRALATVITYGSVQRLNTLDWILNLFLDRPLHTLTLHIRNLLRTAVYQIIYMDNIPAPVVVDESVKLSYRYGHKGVARLVNAVLRKISLNAESLPWPDLEKDPSLHISLVHSVPQWMVKRWMKQIGVEETIKLCRFINKVPPVTIRVNRLKTKRDRLKNALLREGIKTEEVPGLREALRVYPEPGVFLSESSSFQEGLFTIQGESSIFAGRLLHPQPGETLIDVCSAPGGKATHLAEIMENSGLIKAGDIYSAKLNLVEKSARRLGIKVIRTYLWDGREIAQHTSPADAVLCDAPCSGLGVINKKPDLKWAKSEEQIRRLSELQKQLLRASAEAVKEGGKLLYCVCSNEPEETREVIDSFLEENPPFKLSAAPWELPKINCGGSENEGIWEFYPHIHQREGFFMALLEKK